MEKRLLCHRIQSLVELIVVLILQVSRLAGPKRLYFIDKVILLCINIFTIFPLLFFTENYRHRHKLAVLVQKGRNTRLLCILLLIISYVKCDDCTSVKLCAFLHRVLRRAVAAPLHSLCTIFPRECFDGHLLSNHKCRIESETEVADDAAELVLVLLKELTC